MPGYSGDWGTAFFIQEPGHKSDLIALGGEGLPNMMSDIGAGTKKECHGSNSNHGVVIFGAIESLALLQAAVFISIENVTAYSQARLAPC